MSDIKMIKIRANVPVFGLAPGDVVEVAADPMVLGAIANGYATVIEAEPAPVTTVEVEPTTLKSDERVERIARLAGRKPATP